MVSGRALTRPSEVLHERLLVLHDLISWVSLLCQQNDTHKINSGQKTPKACEWEQDDDQMGIASSVIKYCPNIFRPQELQYTHPSHNVPPPHLLFFQSIGFINTRLEIYSPCFMGIIPPFSVDTSQDAYKACPTLSVVQ